MHFNSIPPIVKLLNIGVSHTDFHDKLLVTLPEFQSCRYILFPSVLSHKDLL